MLWGDPQSNRCWRSIADKLPIRGPRRASPSASRRFPADSHALIAIYPNPLNPKRYVVLNSGFTFREYDYLNNARQTPKLPDWAVVDVAHQPDARAPGKVVAADFFGERWELRPRASAPAARDRNQGGRGGGAVIAGRLAMIAALSGAVACSDLGKPAVISPERPATPDAASNRPPPPPEPDAAPPPGFGLPDVPPASDAGDTAAAPGQTMDVVYAHSGSDLFRVDPVTMEVERIGPFTMPNPVTGGVRYLNTVTDIAVDRTRQDHRPDLHPGAEHRSRHRQLHACWRRCPWATGSTACPGSAPSRAPSSWWPAAYDGGLFRIDPATGAATRIGALGGGMQSSGDLVSVASHGTLLTVKGTGPMANDQLVRVDPATGAATVIGPTGFRQIWGLGFWGSKVFGFTQTGQFILIDPRTGAGHPGEELPRVPVLGRRRDHRGHGDRLSAALPAVLAGALVERHRELAAIVPASPGRRAATRGPRP